MPKTTDFCICLIFRRQNDSSNTYFDCSKMNQFKNRFFNQSWILQVRSATAVFLFQKLWPLICFLTFANWKLSDFENSNYKIRNFYVNVLRQFSSFRKKWSINPSGNTAERVYCILWKNDDTYIDRIKIFCQSMYYARVKVRELSTMTGKKRFLSTHV